MKNLSKVGLIHLYIGKGKGKTTAALGLILRAHGAKKKACLIQFLKVMPSSELVVLKKLGVKVVSFKERHPMFYKGASLAGLKKKVAEDINKAASLIKERRYDLIVLDEILYLVSKGLLKTEQLLRLIRSKPVRTELVLTGSYAPKSVINLADYVSTIKQTRHPYKKGILARPGIEY